MLTHAHVHVRDVHARCSNMAPHRSASEMSDTLLTALTAATSSCSVLSAGRLGSANQACCSTLIQASCMNMSSAFSLTCASANRASWLSIDASKLSANASTPICHARALSCTANAVARHKSDEASCSQASALYSNASALA